MQNVKFNYFISAIFLLIRSKQEVTIEVLIYCNFSAVKSAANISNIDIDRWVSENLNKLGKFAKATGNAQYSFNSDNPNDT